MLTASTDALLPVYAQMPVRPVSGHGSWLVDEAGDEWLDAYGGHAVASTGHSHPEVVRAISEQAATLLFYSSVVAHPNREALARELARLVHEPGAVARDRAHGHLRVDRKQRVRGRGQHGKTPTAPRPDVSGRPSARFIAWIAWPPAPLMRLSSTSETCSSRPSSLSAACRSA